MASTSPERFLRITADGGMRAEPIKGTRHRDADPARDALLRQELASSPKDRAENIMIVDLLRNDLSHFAVPGSVSVSRLCAIESYATVHQMVSTIDARLRPGMPRAEAVAACFSGRLHDRRPQSQHHGHPGPARGRAPRRLLGRDRLFLAQRRRPTWRSRSGPWSSRSARRGGSGLSLGVGGAITADSSPQEEYEEIRTKAFGVLSALGAEFPPAEPPS